MKLVAVIDELKGIFTVIALYVCKFTEAGDTAVGPATVGTEPEAITNGDIGYY